MRLLHFRSCAPHFRTQCALLSLPWIALRLPARVRVACPPAAEHRLDRTTGRSHRRDHLPRTRCGRLGARLAGRHLRLPPRPRDRTDLGLNVELLYGVEKPTSPASALAPDLPLRLVLNRNGQGHARGARRSGAPHLHRERPERFPDPLSGRWHGRHPGHPELASGRRRHALRRPLDHTAFLEIGAAVRVRRPEYCGRPQPHRRAARPVRPQFYDVPGRRRGTSPSRPCWASAIVCSGRSAIAQSPRANVLTVRDRTLHG